MFGGNRSWRIYYIASSRTVVIINAKHKAEGLTRMRDLVFPPHTCAGGVCCLFPQRIKSISKRLTRRHPKWKKYKRGEKKTKIITRSKRRFRNHSSLAGFILVAHIVDNRVKLLNDGQPPGLLETSAIERYPILGKMY